MKQLLTLVATILTLTTASAQVELKVNPIGALFSSPDLSAEFAVKDNIGIEPYFGFGWPNIRIDGSRYSGKGVGYGAFGKYYFSPEKGIDKFYAGIYLRGGSTTFQKDSANDIVSLKRNRLAAGMALGYKWVSRNNVVFEIGGGVGRKVYSVWTNELGSVDLAKVPLLNLNGYIKFAIGYRFGGGESADTGIKKKKF